jgi:hypothetical protein
LKNEKQKVSDIERENLLYKTNSSSTNYTDHSSSTSIPTSVNTIDTADEDQKYESPLIDDMLKEKKFKKEQEQQAKKSKQKIPNISAKDESVSFVSSVSSANSHQQYKKYLPWEDPIILSVVSEKGIKECWRLVENGEMESVLREKGYYFRDYANLQPSHMHKTDPFLNYNIDSTAASREESRNDAGDIIVSDKDIEIVDEFQRVETINDNFEDGRDEHEDDRYEVVPDYIVVTGKLNDENLMMNDKRRSSFYYSVATPQARRTSGTTVADKNILRSSSTVPVTEDEREAEHRDNIMISDWTMEQVEWMKKNWMKKTKWTLFNRTRTAGNSTAMFSDAESAHFEDVHPDTSAASMMLAVYPICMSYYDSFHK